MVIVSTCFGESQYLQVLLSNSTDCISLAVSGQRAWSRLALPVYLTVSVRANIWLTH
jgi:hypothetical protein